MSFAFAFSPRFNAATIFFACALLGRSLSVLVWIGVSMTNGPVSGSTPLSSDVHGLRLQLVGGVELDLAARLDRERLLGLDHDLDADSLSLLLLGPRGAGRARELGVGEAVDCDASARREDQLFHPGAVEVGAADRRVAGQVPAPIDVRGVDREG